MIQNYFVIAFRHLLRRKLYAFINILGLAVGLACFLLIYTYIDFELSYDKQHPEADQIYRILRETKSLESNSTYRPHTSGALAGAIAQDLPDAQKVARMFLHGVAFQYQNQFHSKRFCLVDSEFFEIFHFPLVNGDPQIALSKPASILITEEVAKIFFGDENPIGKTVSVADDLMHADYQITGILQDIPSNSSIQFDFLTTHMPSPHFARLQWEDWLPGEWRMTWTFLVLPKQISIKTVEQKLQKLMDRYMGTEISEKNRYHLQPLTRIHLYSGIDYGISSRPDIYQIFLFAAIGILVLFIACANYMNLATAGSMERRKEVGIRKVVGAHRSQLICQFLAESILISTIAVIIATMFVEVALPKFNNLIARDLYFDWNLLPALFGLAVLVGLLAGSYPAFFLSAPQPIDGLKAGSSNRLTGSGLRKGLVIFQFSISILLIISTTVVYRQLQFMNTRDLGFDQDHIVEIWIFGRNGSLRNISNSVKQRFLQHPGIVRATVTSNPGSSGMRPRRATIRVEDLNQKKAIFQLGGDEDFVQVYGLEIVAGRNIRQEAQYEFLINETAAQQFGWSNPIGKQIEWIDQKWMGTIVGVVRDFHYESLHEKVKPVFISKPNLPSNLALKISAVNVPSTLDFIKLKWEELVPDIPFEYRFFDQRIDALYREDRRVGQFAFYSSLLAIFIACLGLFGLASFMLEQRTKEIGIRKVLGASIPNIIVLVTSDFVRLIILSSIVALPIAYYGMDGWLRNFAYRISLDFTLFLFGIVVVLIISMITIGYHALRAARLNPIDSLRNE